MQHSDDPIFAPYQKKTQIYSMYFAWNNFFVADTDQKKGGGGGYK